jgi:hypothetical protein
VSDWIRAADELPHFEKPVLVAWRAMAVDRGRVVERLSVKVAVLTTSVTPPNWQEYPDGDFDCGGEVTHWKHLPEPP